MTKKDIFFKVSFYVLAAIIFVFCAIIVISFAAGYKIDFQNLKVSQTGIVIVKTANRLGDIYIDGHKKGDGRVILRGLNPGHYDLRITKDNYQSYTEIFYLNPGEAKIIDNVVLFLDLPEIKELNDRNDIPFDKLSDTAGITFNHNELFVNGKFLSRFEGQVSDACWYPNERYIGLSVNNHFQIIDIETLHTYPLFEKFSTEPVLFTNSGKSVLYKSNDKIYSAIIR